MFISLEYSGSVFDPACKDYYTLTDSDLEHPFIFPTGPQVSRIKLAALIAEFYEKRNLNQEKESNVALNLAMFFTQNIAMYWGFQEFLSEDLDSDHAKEHLGQYLNNIKKYMLLV